MAIEISESEHMLLDCIRRVIPAISFNQEKLLVMKLRMEFGSDRIYFRSPAYRDRERNIAIRAERESGKTLRQLAQKYRLSPSGIRRICTQPHPSDLDG